MLPAVEPGATRIIRRTRIIRFGSMRNIERAGDSSHDVLPQPSRSSAVPCLMSANGVACDSRAPGPVSHAASGSDARLIPSTDITSDTARSTRRHRAVSDARLAFAISFMDIRRAPQSQCIQRQFSQAQTVTRQSPTISVIAQTHSIRNRHSRDRALSQIVANICNSTLPDAPTPPESCLPRETSASSFHVKPQRARVDGSRAPGSTQANANANTSGELSAARYLDEPVSRETSTRSHRRLSRSWVRRRPRPTPTPRRVIRRAIPRRACFT